jgi:glutamate racemase
MKKIGLLDSGIGGLSLLRDLIKSKLDADYFYISDSINVPYGGKSQSFMLRQLKLMVNKLIDKNVETIIIACNTATSETINQLRDYYDIPFIGIEPYINYLNHTTNESLALILTEATFNSKRLKDLVLKYDSKGEVKIFPLKNLALIIEKLFEKSFDELEPQIRNELEFLQEIKIDSLILGCTHYPLISKFLEKSYNIKTIDPNKFVIIHLSKALNLKPKAKENSTFQYSRNIKSKWVGKHITDFNIFY